MDNQTDNLPEEKDPTELSIMGSLADPSTREPLAGTHTAHVSTMFQANLALNPLIAAAAPLLSLASRFSVNSPKTAKTLLNTLINEIKALEIRAQELGYRAPVILATRYLLCSLLDETLIKSDWGKQHQWDQKSLLAHFQKEAWGGERFFVILQRCAEEPEVYIDLLELCYICLSLGFQGKYAQSHDYHGLAAYIDNLYEVICHQRGELSKQLLISHDDDEQKKVKSAWYLPPIWLTAVIAIAILVAIFIPYYISLQKLSHPLQKTLHSLQNFMPKQTPTHSGEK